MKRSKSRLATGVFSTALLKYSGRKKFFFSTCYRCTRGVGENAGGTVKGITVEQIIIKVYYSVSIETTRCIIFSCSRSEGCSQRALQHRWWRLEEYWYCDSFPFWIAIVLRTNIFLKYRNIDYSTEYIKSITVHYPTKLR